MSGFQRMDIHIHHPDGRLERVVVFHQFFTPPLATIDERMEAKSMGQTVEVVDDAVLNPFKGVRASASLSLCLLDKIRRTPA